MDDDPSQFDVSAYTTLSDDLPQKQFIVDGIVGVVLPGTTDNDVGGVSPFPDTDLGLLYGFLAKHSSMGAIRIRGALLDQTLRFLALGPVIGDEGASPSASGMSWEDRQKQLVKLLQRLCASALWDTNDPEDFLPLVQRCRMYKTSPSAPSPALRMSTFHPPPLPPLK